VVFSVVYTIYHNSPVVWCLYTTSGLWFVVIMVNKKRHLEQVNCDIMYIQQSIPQITIHLLYIDTLQQVNCDIMYIQQSIPQITIHLLYKVTLQHVDCVVICGAVCCIYIISQFTCCKVSIYNKWIVICGVFCCIYIIPQSTCCKVTLYNKWIVICGLFFLSIVISFQSRCLFLLTIMTTNHNPLVVYRHHTTGELWYIVYTTEYTTEIVWIRTWLYSHKWNRVHVKIHSTKIIIITWKVLACIKVF
jgi:hypothetical protein